MSYRIPLSSVSLSQLEAQHAQDAISSGWISGSGNYVTHFEEQLTHRLNRTHAIATTNGTAALELALLGLGIATGDEVIIPALTFAAVASAVIAVGATPVFADVTEESWTLDPDAVRSLITPRSKAIIAVDLIGHPCNYDLLLQCGLPIIEDAAEAHGALYRGQTVGQFGVISVFSFHANKAITTGEGGCVATDDQALAERMRLIANHGMHASQPYWHTMAGKNYRMTNVTAAIGCAQLQRWDELIAARNAVAATYRTAFDFNARNRQIQDRPTASWATPSCWLQCITVEQAHGVVDQGRRNGIDMRTIWAPLHQQPAFRDYQHGPCLVSERISAKAILLPTWSYMPAPLIHEVVATVLQATDLLAQEISARRHLL